MKGFIQTALNSGKAAIVGLAFLALSCAPQTSSVATDCVVNDDQASLFMGQWTTHPVPLAIVANDFSASEIDAIAAAITTWNTFFSASKGFQLYLSGSSALTVVASGGTRATQSTVCGTNVLGPSGFTGKIMLYKNTSGWSYGSSIMALTSVCPITIANASYKKYVSAVMEINFQNYFNAGQSVPDLQSIVTHELGHMLGLNHSCTGSGCNNASSDYISAMMYPTLGFDGTTGRVKRDLTTNDQQRANCLY